MITYTTIIIIIILVIIYIILLLRVLVIYGCINSAVIQIINILLFSSFLVSILNLVHAYFYVTYGDIKTFFFFCKIYY